MLLFEFFERGLEEAERGIDLIIKIKQEGTGFNDIPRSLTAPTTTTAVKPPNSNQRD